MQHLVWILAMVFTFAYGLGWDLVTLLAVINWLLRNARKAQGWTIEDAAEIVGVDVSTYARWERGVQIPHPQHAKALEQVFGTVWEELEVNHIWSFKQGGYNYLINNQINMHVVCFYCNKRSSLGTDKWLSSLGYTARE